MKNLLNIFFAVFLAILFSGCMSKSVKPTTYYPLVIADIAKKSEFNAQNGVVKVLQPMSKHSLNSNAIIYKLKNEQNEYTQSKFSDPLSKIIQYYLVDTLENSDKFKGVIFSASSAKYDYTVESNILKFEHNIANQSVDVEIKLILINRSKDIVSMKKFAISKDVSEQNAKGAVAAFELSLSELQREINLWLTSI